MDEREDHGVAERTASLWAFLDQPVEQRHIINPVYTALGEALRPSFRPQSLHVWRAFFGRWTLNLEPIEETHMLQMFMRDRKIALDKEVEVREAELRELEAKLAAKVGA